MKTSTRLLSSCFILFALLLAAGCNKKEILQPGAGEFQLRSNIHLVTEAVATQIAEHFDPDLFFSHAKGQQQGIGTDRRLEDLPALVPGAITGRNAIKKLTKFVDRSGLPAFYTFSFTNNKGFVIVSADSGLRPILAYVPKGEFDEKRMPGGLTDWIKKTTANVEIARQGSVDTRNNIASWKAYANSMNHPATQRSVSLNGVKMNVLPPPDTNPCDDPNFTDYSEFSVGPLLPVEWGQADGYNDALGFASCYTTSWNGRYPTGCVATAMAQVIRYWQWPTSYNYSLMPTSSGNSHVQTLMQDVGTSLGMVYNCTGSSPGSSPTRQAIYLALVGSFNYSPSTSYATYSHSGSDYTTIKSNINNSRPVILTGTNSVPDPGHCWVTDGYLEATYRWCDNGNLVGCTYLLFHMNWGWNEVWATTNYNGWYAYDNWYVNSHDLNYYTSFVYNITP